MQTNMLCQQQQLSVPFVFLTFPMISSPNSSRGKKARHSSNRSCSLGVVALSARKNLDQGYVGTSSTNTDSTEVLKRNILSTNCSARVPCARIIIALLSVHLLSLLCSIYYAVDKGFLLLL